MEGGLYLASVILFLGLRIPLMASLPSAEFSAYDATVHKMIVEKTRSNRHRIPKKFPQFLLDSGFDYPAFFHKLVSYLPERLLPYIYRYNNVLWDLVQLSLIYWGGSYLLSLSAGPASPVVGAFLASLLMAFTPLYLDSMPRLMFGERAFGDACGASALFLLFLFVETGQGWALPGAWILIAVTAASSKFGLQAIVLCSLVASAFLARPIILLVAVSGILLSFFLSGGYTFQVLRGTIRHALFYKTHYLKVYKGLWNPPFHRETMGIFRDLLRRDIRSAVIAAFNLRSPLGKAILYFPWIPLALWGLMAARPPMSPFFWFGMSGFVVCLLISVPALRFLGEPERYILYTAPFMFWWVADGSIRSGSATRWSWITGSAILYLGFEYSVWRKITKARRAEEGQEREGKPLVDFLKGCPGSRILAIPLRIGFPILRGAAVSAIQPFVNAPKGRKWQEYKELIPVEYPFPDADLDPWIRRYEVDLVVVSKADLKLYQEAHPEKNYNFSNYPLVFDSGAFSIYGAKEARG